MPVAPTTRARCSGVGASGVGTVDGSAAEVIPEDNARPGPAFLGGSADGGQRLAVTVEGEVDTGLGALLGDQVEGVPEGRIAHRLPGEGALQCGLRRARRVDRGRGGVLVLQRVEGVLERLAVRRRGVRREGVPRLLDGRAEGRVLRLAGEGAAGEEEDGRGEGAEEGWEDRPFVLQSVMTLTGVSFCEFELLQVWCAK